MSSIKNKKKDYCLGKEHRELLQIRKDRYQLHVRFIINHEKSKNLEETVKKKGGKIHDGSFIYSKVKKSETAFYANLEVNSFVMVHVFSASLV